jgi:hypothetical protein
MDVCNVAIGLNWRLDDEGTSQNMLKSLVRTIYPGRLTEDNLDGTDIEVFRHFKSIKLQLAPAVGLRRRDKTCTHVVRFRVSLLDDLSCTITVMLTIQCDRDRVEQIS